jgi:hypothetical protein
MPNVHAALSSKYSPSNETVQSDPLLAWSLGDGEAFPRTSWSSGPATPSQDLRVSSKSASPAEAAYGFLVPSLLLQNYPTLAHSGDKLLNEFLYNGYT